MRLTYLYVAFQVSHDQLCAREGYQFYHILSPERYKGSVNDHVILEWPLFRVHDSSVVFFMFQKQSRVLGKKFLYTFLN